MSRQIKTDIRPGLLGIALTAESPPCPAVSRVTPHRKSNSCHPASAARSLFRAGCVCGSLMVCLFGSPTMTSAQVRLGLGPLMPGLEPQAVTASITAPPSLIPGETHIFAGPDAVGGANNPAFIGATAYVADETPLRAFAYSVNSLQSSSASAYQYNDFAIPASVVAGGVTDSVVSAQISGSVSVRGFLFAMGAVEASAGVNVEVLDITDTNAPVVVNSQRIADYEADDRLSPSVGGEVQVAGQAGFPYVGVNVGGGIQVALQLSPILNFVRDDKVFGFLVLLRRGHVYRVQTELSVDTSDRLMGGTAIASFFSPASGGPVIPNVFDPEPTTDKGAENSWLSLLRPKAGAIPDLQVAKGNADVICRSVDVGGGTLNYASVWNQSISDVINPLGFGFLSANEADKKFSGHALFGQVFAAPPLTINQLVENSPFLNVQNESGFESIPLPGVAVNGPTITLANDPVELAERAKNHAIEENLKQHDVLVSLYLPAAFGGEFERCTNVVSGLIVQAKAAGYRTQDAELSLTQALVDQRLGKYKYAYQHLLDAYDKLAGDAKASTQP